jgi:shikimate kinase
VNRPDAPHDKPDSTLQSTVILIGPMSAGKSTIAQCLAEKLGIPRYEVDEHRLTYYREIDYDNATAAQIFHSEGMVGLMRYWKPFEAYAVERVVAEHRGCVIDFGAGHTVHEDEALFERVSRALAPFPNVILLLPSPDLDESVRVVNDRFAALLQREFGTVDPALLQVNEHFVRHPSNHRLAKIVVYTDGKTPDETCAEVLQRIAGS